MQKGKHAFESVALALAGLATLATAQEIPHLTVAQPGGFPGRPILTGITKTTNGVNVMWDGPAGYYQLYVAQSLANPTWQPIGTPNFNRNLTLTNLSGQAFFKVSGPSAQFAGAQACAECHEDIYNLETRTPHAHALQTLKNIHQDANANCVACHTVGFGLPTGFKTELTTPHLAGVQCESCHGPAAAHAANEMDLTRRPRQEIAGEVCGGCHTGANHPTYDEWKSSGHFAVVEDMTATSRINSCGRCHSGSVRLAMIGGAPTNVISATLTNDANVGITCVVCHDPHETHVWTNVVTRVVYTNQLRQALSSTNDFFLTTSDIFTNNYDPNINLCAQCHNHRGASWSSSSRPPHHSPQYNMLLGTVGVLRPGVTGGPAAHAGTSFLSDSTGRLFTVTNQCVTCHMQTAAYQHGPPEVAADTGHKFTVGAYGACTDCHGPGINDANVGAWRNFFADQIQQVKSLLDDWAQTKAPVQIQKYGVLAWEYDNAGQLSSPDGKRRGPVSSTNAALDEQKYVPDAIKKARFNLYLVLHDGSYGLHNGPYTLTLLDSARYWIQQASP